jgi:hypothetical protein
MYTCGYYEMRRNYLFGFVLLVTVWIVMTLMCYHKIIIFDNTTLGGAMISGLVLSVSIVGMIRFLKIIYDEFYRILANEPDGNTNDESNS